jgi:hypothetical protein
MGMNEVINLWANSQNTKLDSSLFEKMIVGIILNQLVETDNIAKWYALLI